jgi:transglutaminase-like putative cysteine protease
MRAWLRAAQVVENSLAARVAVFATACVAGLGMALTAGGTVTVAVSLTVIAAGHTVSWRGRNRPRTGRGQLLIGALIVACIVYLLLDLILAIFGGALPQAKFAVLTLAVTSFDLKSRRNLFSHVWHSATVLYVGALFAWDATYIGILLLWVGAFFAFLLFTRRGSRPVDSGDILRRVGARTARRAAPWLAVWLVVGVAFFVAIPRVAGRPLAVPVLVSIPLSQNATAEVLPGVLPLVGTDPAGGQEGSINLRARGRLGEEVMFRVRAPASSYWRAYVLEKYEGQSWSRVLHPARPIPPVSAGLPILDEITTTGPGLPQTFYIERPLPAEVIASYPLRELYFPASSLVLVDNGTVNTPFGLRKGVNYSGVSQVRDLSPQALRAALPLTGQEAPADLQVPGSVPARVKQMARQLTAVGDTEYDKVRAVVDHLQQNYRYSLDTPRLPTGADAVDQFLFADHVGFCEQFASALAMLLREVGIPSRVAIGYGSGEHDTLTGTFTVRAKEAHAWVEVLFPGVGWVPFDASPGFDSTPFAHAPPRWFLSDFSPQVALSALGGETARNVGAGAGVVGAAVILVAMAWLWRRGPRSPELRAYNWALRWIRWSGLPGRAPPQTPTEHWLMVQSVAPGVGDALAPVREALEDAVYGERRRRRARHWQVLLASLRHGVGGGG